ncbi:MAG TPA: zf-HC2 domain-containing protein [Pyrinomonadaceae bacterium]|nr:zf-HC2 domain-containing protein [Pyrinomonadaceae bacterium]
MKCDDCVNLLETYLDGEATERESDQIQTHLATCSMCANKHEALTAENEMFARYDREVEVTPALWNGVAARIALEDRQAESKSKPGLGEWIAGWFAMPSFRFAAPTMALVLIALLIGLAYWRTKPQQPTHDNLIAHVDSPKPVTSSSPASTVKPSDQSITAPASAGTNTDSKEINSNVLAKYERPSRPNMVRSSDQSDVLPDTESNNGGTMEERDTASHLEQAQNLLLSFRNIKYSDTDEEVDVSYEKSESRRLLSENIMLRREAESSGKFPAKSVLGSLEPFLIDIANLPDKAKPTDVRQITDRVQRTEIVAELRSY